MLKTFFDNALVELHAFKKIVAQRNGQAELRDKWNKNPGAFSKNSDHFYQHEVGDSYLYDLAAWHAGKTLYPWGQMAHGIAKGTVWDFGGGIGTYALLCAAKDTVETVYFDDINPDNVEFAQWRFKKHNLLHKIKMGSPPDKVDVILAFDVIEHLTDAMGQIIKFTLHSDPGTHLVVNITAHDSGGEHPMHVIGPTEAALWWEELGKHWEPRISGSPSSWRKR